MMDNEIEEEMSLEEVGDCMPIMINKEDIPNMSVKEMLYYMHNERLAISSHARLNNEMWKRLVEKE